MLVAFAAALAVMAPKLVFVLQHPSMDCPPGGGDYRLSLVKGISYFRAPDARGVMQGWASVRCSSETGGSRGWAGARSFGTLHEVPTRGSPSGAE
jgi:hypothetical protein